MKAYSTDLRERVVTTIDRGLPRADAAQVFSVSASTIKRWLRRRDQTGSLVPSPIPGRPAVVSASLASGLEPQLRAHPDATIAEHCARWQTESGQVVSPTSIRRAIVRLDWTRKKRV